MADRKPIHVQPIPEGISDETKAELYNAAAQIAQDKLDQFMPHFGDEVKLDWFSQEDGKEIRFYIGVKVTF